MYNCPMKNFSKRNNRPSARKGNTYVENWQSLGSSDCAALLPYSPIRQIFSITFLLFSLEFLPVNTENRLSKISSAIVA